jgi:hypothetical protein
MKADPNTTTKSKKQVAYLLSKVSPLSGKQQGKLKGEMHKGKVKVEKGEDSRR